MDLWIDLETRCRLDLKQVGLHRYAEEAEIIITAWAWNATPPTVQEGPPDEGLEQAIAIADRVMAHNAEFDCTILEEHGIWVPFEKRYCTMAQAHRHGLPGGLEKLCEIFRIEDALAKQKDGRELMQIFCKPRKDGGWNDKHSHPNEWARFLRYGGSDSPFSIPSRVPSMASIATTVLLSPRQLPANRGASGKKGEETAQNCRI